MRIVSALIGVALALPAAGLWHGLWILDEPPTLQAAVPTGAPDGRRSAAEPGGAALPARQDTIIAVDPGDVFVSETLRGSLIVRVGGDEVRLSGDPDEMPMVVRDGREVRLRPGRGGRDADLLLELPVWMPLSVRSRDLDVSVSDLEAETRIEVLSGDIRLDDVSAPVEVRTVDGEVEVRRTEGAMDLFTADGDVRVVGHRGRLRVESTDGDITLRDIEGRSLGASTLDGDIEFDGAVMEEGFLELSAHDGDVTVGLPASVQADVEVSTFHGEFTSDFRVRTGGFKAGEPLRFRIGNGAGARIMLRSFDGDISIHSR